MGKGQRSKERARNQAEMKERGNMEEGSERSKNGQKPEGSKEGKIEWRTEKN